MGSQELRLPSSIDVAVEYLKQHDMTNFLTSVANAAAIKNAGIDRNPHAALARAAFVRLRKEDKDNTGLEYHPEYIGYVSRRAVAGIYKGQPLDFSDEWKEAAAANEA